MTETTIPMSTHKTTRVLVVTDHAAATPELLSAIRERPARRPIDVLVHLPNPAPAEWHPTPPKRAEKTAAAQAVLERALAPIERAPGGLVSGQVSTHHDPMDAIEETLYDQ